jgi:carbamate kinase
MQTLENALRRRANPRHVACLLTQVEVDPDDPAFEHPSKPIGFFYSEEQAGKVAREFDWVMREDAGRGWRHVVASPLPQHIVNVSLIERVLTSGAVVIAGGGGGIPVQRLEDGTRRGIEAVIDKDFTSAMMANLLNIDTFLMLTEVDNVIVDFGTDKAQPLAQVSIERIQSLYDAGQFPEGSMGPKVKAALNFLEGGGRRAAIGSLEQAEAVYKGTAGTQILS